MSNNVIKARDDTSFTPFDFEEIAMMKARGSETAEGEPSEEHPPVDPLQELEDTIRNRLAEAERNAIELEKEGYEKGYAKGLEEGLERGRENMESVKQDMEEILDGFHAIPGKVLGDYRNWFIAACMAVVKRIVPKAAEKWPRELIRLIETVLDETRDHQSLAIYVHPMDLELLAKQTDLKERIQQWGRHFAMKADPSMTRGGCRAESDIQVVDATIETQLALLEETMRNHEPTAEEPAPQ